MVLSFVESLRKRIRYHRQIFELSDGGELALDWLIHPNQSQVKRNIVVCVPGLSGDSHELYCTALAREALAQNLDFVVVNYRGTSGVPLRTAKLYDSGDTKDLDQVIDYLYSELCLDSSGR